MGKLYFFMGKVDEIEPARKIDSRDCYFKEPYFDKTARRRFESKQEKRNWMRKNGMREGGLIKPKEVGL